MKKTFILVFLLGAFICHKLFAQVAQYNPACSTPNLDSATAVALPYYDNNQILEDYLNRNGYNNLAPVSFTSPIARTSTTSFPEPKFLIPLNLFIYRNGANDPASSISENQAREYICSVNEIYRNAGTAIQFYTNRVEIIASEFFHSKISSTGHVYDMWSSQRIAEDESKGINIHFIRNNKAPESSEGKASLPHYPMAPYTEYSILIRTHRNNEKNKIHPSAKTVGTLVHEIGHALGLLHTHHPGRLPSLANNQQNGTITNGCLQESVSRNKKNKRWHGCIETHNKLKCEVNGDFLCDTEADPGQSSGVKGCSYVHPASGDFKVDNWNMLWNPPTSNIMAYANDKCRVHFSRGQIAILWMQMPALQDFIHNEAPDVTEPEIICYGSTSEISLNSFPAEASVSWEVKPSNLLRLSKGTGPSARLSSVNTSSGGSATITFTISGPNNCYMATIEKQVQVESLADRQFEVIGQQEVCSGQLYTYTATPQGEHYTYQWKFPNHWTKISQTGSQITLSVPYAHPNGNTVEVSVSNGCEASPYSGVMVYPAATCNPYSFTAYPNPAKEELTVELLGLQETRSSSVQQQKTTPTAAIPQVPESFSFKLYNGEQKEVAFVQDIRKKVRLNISSLPAGIYFLHVHDGRVVQQKQIIVER